METRRATLLSKLRVTQCLLLFASMICLTTLKAQSVDFSNEYDRVFQIQSISKDAEAKSSIGSGFQVSADGLIVTNYHVVSQYITQPDSYNIQYAAQDGSTGTLKLLNFDIVNDLALLQHPNPKKEFFKLSNTTPDRGAIAYALGNPGDWGMVMVPGPTNGHVEHSYRKQILFTGSLNSGMSGGPALNAAKEIVGVNVATAGSQLSFLVPVNYVQRLIEQTIALEPDNFHQAATDQIKAWQRPRLQQLIDESWNTVDFHDRPVATELRRDFQCWGGSNDDDNERAVNASYRSCSAGDHIYISGDVDTGHVEYYFTHHTPEKLNDVQFSIRQDMVMYADNQSNYANSTNFVCQSDFLHTNAENDEKTDGESTGNYKRMVSCIRAYKKYPGLFDSMVTILNNRGKEIVQSQMTIAGAEKDQIMALNKKFAELAQ